jgi:cardiolipin synthase
MNDVAHMLIHVHSTVQLVLGPILALAVTLHVLLRKRQVASSVGWIGLAWVAPFIGAAAYFVLGVNRVRRRAQRERRGVARRRRGEPEDERIDGDDGHLRPLRRGVRTITDRQGEPGNDVQVLHDGDEAYPEMLAAIETARASVGLSTYIMRDDTVGCRFIEALKAAQARGVAVRVIVDGIGSGWLASHAYHHLRRAGVPSQRFMHSVMPWRMPFLNLRTHKKILVVDGRIGFTGGINIADQNILATKPRNPVQDTHFRLRGPVVAQLVDAFARDWSFLTDEDLDGDAWFPTLEDSGTALARVVTAGPDEDLEKIEFTVLQAVACARGTIRLMTPYFLPDDQLITSLAMASMRGVTVEVILPERSDHRLVDWAVGANIGPLLHDGGKVFRSPAPFRHSKVMVVDDEWCLVGSSNWDMRSFRLNFELCVEVYSRDLAAQLQALMARNKGRPMTQDEIDARTVPMRLRDAAVRLLLPYL